MSLLSEKAIAARSGEQKRPYFVNKETEEAMKLEVAQLVQRAQQDYKAFVSRLTGERPRTSSGGNVRFFSNDEDMEEDAASATSFDDLFSSLGAFTLPEHFIDVDLASNKNALEDMRAAEAREQEQKRQYARRLWSETVPLVEGSGAWNYLKGRRIEAERYPLPKDVRMSRDGLTLVAGYRNTDGEIVAVQKTPVTADGKKNPYKTIQDDGTVKVTPKKAYGRLKEGYLFLTGIGPGKIAIVAEGLETGLSLWHATHHDVIVFGGAINSKKIPALVSKVSGNLVLLARDDDAPSNQASTQFIKSLRGLFASGVTVREITPNRRRRGDGTDFNDLLQKAADRRSGLRAVKLRVRRGVARGSHDQLAETRQAQESLRDTIFGLHEQITEHEQRVALAAAGRSAWRRSVAAKLEGGEAVTDIAGLVDNDTPPPLQIGVPYGVGTKKTGLAIEFIKGFIDALRAAGDTRAVAFFVPQHRLGADVMRRFAEDAPGLKVRRWISKPVEVSERGAANVVHACTEYPSFAWKTKVGLEPSGPCPGCDGKCEHAQAFNAVTPKAVEEEGVVDVWVMAHAAAFSPELPKPVAEYGLAMAFYDETVWPSSVKADYHLTAADIAAAPLVIERTKSEIKSDIPLHSIQLKQQDARLALKRLLELEPKTFVTAEHLRDAGMDQALAKAKLAGTPVDEKALRERSSTKSGTAEASPSLTSRACAARST